MAPQKIDVRIIFFRLGRLTTLVLKNYIVREVGCFSMSCHIYARMKFYIQESKAVFQWSNPVFIAFLVSELFTRLLENSQHEQTIVARQIC